MPDFVRARNDLLRAAGHAPTLAAPPAQLASLADHAPVGLVVVDHEGTILDANTTFRALVRDPAPDARASKFRSILSPASQIFFDTHVLPHTLVTGRVDEVALELNGAAGRLPVLLSAALAPGDRDVITLSLMPVAARRRYERELLAERQTAEQALTQLAAAQAELRARSRTDALNIAATGLAHELNQPLTSAMAQLALAKRLRAAAPDDPRLALALDAASHACLAAAAVVRQLRTRTTRPADRHGEASPGMLIDSAVSAARQQREIALANLEIEIATDAPAICCDAEQVGYALGELLLNAFEAAAPDADAKVRVSAAKDPDGGLLLSISDDGAGLPDGDVYRLGFTTKDNRPGMGMPTARTIIELEGGRIRLAPRPERGTVVQVRFGREAA